MKNTNNNKKGFTIVEYFIVVTIIGLLAAMAIPAFKKVREHRRNAIKIESIEKTDQSFVVLESAYIDGRSYTIVKHKETGIVYITNSNLFTPLLEKDGKPLIKY